jgi:hypothetical protein
MTRTAFAAVAIVCFSAVTASFAFTNHVEYAKATGFFTAVLIGLEIARDLIETRRFP